MAVSLNGPDNIWTTARKGLTNIGDELSASESFVQLEDTYHRFMNSDHAFWKTYKNISRKCTKLFNSIRIFNITIINYGILTMFGYLLVLLFGISDTCAQSLSQLFEGGGHPRTWLTFHDNSIFSENSTPQNTTITLTNDIDRTASEEEINVFVDYGDDETNDSIGAQPYNPDLNMVEYSADSQLSEFDFRRFLGFITWGFIMAFIQVVWYMFLNAMFNDMPTMVSVLERDLTDQLLFSPISLACFFAYATIVIEGGTTDDFKDKMYRVYITTYAVSFCVWFPVQFINFSIMPKKFQVPFSSSVGVIWNCYLSYSNAKFKSE
ncbi:hypothetical protein CANINC_002969 [Pichia inconspicua]|uniref:Uncharacterized protein n=1 Tax=Pichia inconspicua TaxID=52247 RepID=A0A4T0X067_9ASCO|nr:hypothetical protein CANINC_002969 [[Candida] inconspicua]